MFGQISRCLLDAQLQVAINLRSIGQQKAEARLADNRLAIAPDAIPGVAVAIDVGSDGD